jgi:DNA-binding CsgD family transcriptional regulator
MPACASSQLQTELVERFCCLSEVSNLERELIGMIYDAALDSTHWPVFLDRLASQMSAGCGVLLLHDTEAAVSQCAHASGVPQELQDEYAEYYGAQDPWLLGWRQVPMGVVFPGEKIIAPSTLGRSEYYNDFLRRLEVERIDAAAIMRSDTRLMAVSVNSTGSADDAVEFRALLQNLVPHLQRAAQIHRHCSELATRADAAEVALDALTMGVFLVGFDGKLRSFNAAARRILATRPELYLDRTGRLRARAINLNHRLDHLLREAVETGAGRGSSAGGGFALGNSETPNALTLLVTPLAGTRPHPLGVEGVAAAVLVSDPTTVRTVPARRLAAQFGLTAKESQLLSLLIAGKTPETAADELRVSIATVRTHLRHLLVKMNCARQSDLMRVTINSVAVMTNTETGAELNGD